MKYLILCTLLGLSLQTLSQEVDTNYLKHLYDRCLDFDESRSDSIFHCADFIAREANRLHYNRGEVLSSRLRGIAHDLKGNYDSAIVYYLQSLQAARNLNAGNYESAALADLAYVYVNTKQPARAKEMYLQAAQLAEANNDLGGAITSYGNLGAIYNQLHQTDSALFYLNKGLSMKQPLPHKMDLSFIYNNLGNVYYGKGDYARALSYFEQNHRIHAKSNSLADLWSDKLNLADVLIEMKDYTRAFEYATQSLALAQQMNARSKIADSYALLGKLYYRKADYKNAYEYQQKWYAIDTSLVNTRTNETIASLQEKFHARQRDKDNRLLQLDIQQALLKNRAITILAIAAALTAIIIGFLLL
ncbi:MAG TPA: tetratricopeptide repeat protein, partial [Chitinophagaceae bacterium]|nr:tetratricopeptide repeat protein [Chitinophagaceae bacterium]